MQALHFTVREGAEMKGSKRGAHLLQQAIKGGEFERYEHFASLVNERPPAEPARPARAVGPAGQPVPLDEVEPAADIMARFSTGAMSHGSLSAEAHETLAMAMNLSAAGRTAARAARTRPASPGPGRATRTRASSRSPPAASASPRSTWPTPTSSRSRSPRAPSRARAASCPGHKVSAEIARLRHTQPGVGLISPPPHHDIYSIEDLAQLIFDLKQVNGGRGVGEAGRRGRGGHDRRRRGQGAGRRGA